MFQNNEVWKTFEKLKNQLRDAGCQGLANEIYKMQLKLESELTKEFLCSKKSTN